MTAGRRHVSWASARPGHKVGPGAGEYSLLNGRARFGGALGVGEPPGEPQLGRNLTLPRRVFAHGDSEGPP